MLCKTWLWRLLPGLAEARLDIADEALVVVVVDNYLMALPVAFTWCEDDSTSILEHWDEVGNDNSLCEEVLTCSEKIRALPLPAAVALAVVASVTGP